MRSVSGFGGMLGMDDSVRPWSADGAMDGGRPGPDAPWALSAKALFGEEALRAVTRGPRFRAVAEASTAEAMRHYRGLDVASRWLLKDVGRTSIYVAALALHALPGGLTMSGLTSAVVASGAASRGRVVAFVDYALAAGRLDIAPGSLPWTRRPLIPRPAFVDVLRDRLAGFLAVMGPLDPSLTHAAPRLSDNGVLVAGYLRIAQVAASMRALGAPRLTRIEFFLDRDGGMKVLQDLVGRQEPDRARLLEVATISRTQIAQACGVSRVHLNTLLEDAEAAGLLTRVGRNSIVFDPALNDSYELWVAMQVQVARLAADAVLRHQT